MRIYLFDNQEVIKFLTYVSTDITTQKVIVTSTKTGCQRVLRNCEKAVPKHIGEPLQPSL